MLLAMDRNSKKCNMVWEMLEKIVMSAVMMSEGNQAAADNFVSASTEKIKNVLTQVGNDPIPEKDAKVIPPPPPPPPPGGMPVAAVAAAKVDEAPPTDNCMYA